MTILQPKKNNDFLDFFYIHLLQEFARFSLKSIFSVCCILWCCLYGNDDAIHTTDTSTLMNETADSLPIHIESFTLIDAKTDKDIAPIAHGEIINIFYTGRYLNIRANTHPDTIGSVLFEFDTNTQFQIENFVPYSLAGDNKGDYFYLNTHLGIHTIRATPYSKPNGKGRKGQTRILRITFVDYP